MTTQDTDAQLAQRHDRLLREVESLQLSLTGQPGGVRVFDLTLDMLQQERQVAEAGVCIPFVSQVGAGKSTLIAAASGLRLEGTQSTPRAWSVLPVDRGRTTLGQLELIFEERDDLRVEVQGWPPTDLERELRLVAEDVWAQVHRPAELTDRSGAGLELQELFRQWVARPDDTAEDPSDDALERLARQHPTDLAAFVEQVVARAELPSRQPTAQRGFAPGALSELKTYLMQLMRGGVPGVSAPLQTTLRLPSTYRPEGVDSLIDTQGLEANAQGILIEARGDILEHLDNPLTPLVVCSAFETAPDLVSQALLQRALERRREALPEPEPLPAQVVLLLVDKEGDDGDPDAQHARQRRLRECKGVLQKQLGARAAAVQVEVIDARAEGPRLRALLSEVAGDARAARRQRWLQALERAERYVERTVKGDRIETPRLRALELRLIWEWEAGVAQAGLAQPHPLELLAGAVSRRESSQIGRWSHINAAARRRGRYSKLDLGALAGRLAAAQRCAHLRAGWAAVRRALALDGALHSLDAAEHAYGLVFAASLYTHAERTEKTLREQTTQQVHDHFASDKADRLWSLARGRWGQGPGYVEDIAALFRAEAQGTPALRAPPPSFPARDVVSRWNPALLQLRALQLENFRLFTHLNLTFGQHTLIVGDNGAGKTTTLDALAALLAPLVSQLTHGELPELGPRDVRVETFEGLDSPQEAPPQPLVLEVSAELEGALVQWHRRATRSLERLREEGSWEELTRLASRTREELTRPTPRQLPVVAYYRLERRSLSTEPPDPDQVLREARLDGYRGCLTAGLEFKVLLQWVRKQTFAALQRKRPSRLLEGISRAVARCVQGVQRLHYDIAAEELQLVLQDGRVLPLDVMSSGYRSIVSLVADIAWRACVLNPQLQDFAPELTEGVVLIDELDLHLHPTWQRRVLKDLQRAFPRVQLIVTTHSPQVIAAAEPGWVRVLYPEGEVGSAEHTLGVDTNTLLREVFGDDAYPRETLARIGQIREELARGDTLQAAAALDELEQDLGGLAEVVRTLRWELLEAQGEEE